MDKYTLDYIKIFFIYMEKYIPVYLIKHVIKMVHYVKDYFKMFFIKMEKDLQEYLIIKHIKMDYNFLDYFYFKIFIILIHK